MSTEAMHASAPEGCKCSDCTMDREACPTCYAAWWTKRHPNVIQINPGSAGIAGVQANPGKGI